MNKFVDVLVAAVLMVISSTVAWRSFAEIEAHRSRTGLIDRPLTLGAKSIAVMGPAGCVGLFDLALERLESEMQFRVEGRIRTSYRQRAADFTVQGDLVFNLIGQLGGGIVRLGLLDERLTVGFEDVDPIRVTLISPRVGSEGRRQFQIPGPFELSPLPGNTFQPRYAPLAQRELPLAGVIPQYASMLQVSVDESPSAVAECRAAELRALALDEFGDQVFTQWQGLLKLLPQAATGVVGE